MNNGILLSVRRAQESYHIARFDKYVRLSVGPYLLCQRRQVTRTPQ